MVGAGRHRRGAAEHMARGQCADIRRRSRSEPQVASAEPSPSGDQNAATSNAVADPQPAPAVAAARQDNSDDSRDAWFEEILAMLSGALAAGAVAWFLFGAAPQRMYG